MSLNDNKNLQPNRARRHFLGIAAATGARLAAIGASAATILPGSVARALGRKPPKDGPGSGPQCFLRGTAISTPFGETCIEAIRIGDSVLTADGRAMPVKWVGRHIYRRSGPTWNAHVVPIRISRHALDDRTPHRDLYLSPGHALLIDGVLVHAQDLVNGISITPALAADTETIEYYHIVLDSHAAILAEGAAAETLLLKQGDHEGFTNFAEFARLYPDGMHPAMTPFAPSVGYGGRAHLKALMRLWLRRFVPVGKPVQTIFERISDRAEQRVG